MKSVADIDTLTMIVTVAGLPFPVIDAVKEHRDNVAPFIEQHRLHFPALLDTDGTVSTRYGVRGLLATYRIDCTGNVVRQALGAREWISEAVRTLLTALSSAPNCR
jgi:hypothetical protein